MNTVTVHIYEYSYIAHWWIQLQCTLMNTVTVHIYEYSYSAHWWIQLQCTLMNTVTVHIYEYSYSAHWWIQLLCTSMNTVTVHIDEYIYCAHLWIQLQCIFKTTKNSTWISHCFWPCCTIGVLMLLGSGMLKRQASVRGFFLKLASMSDWLQLLHSMGAMAVDRPAMIHFPVGSIHLQCPAHKIYILTYITSTSIWASYECLKEALNFVLVMK